jgi:predicted DNA repair protein MutK
MIAPAPGPRDTVTWTMAASLLALLDDIASVLDDVAVLTKAATQKTAGVLGDDLALNAQQVAGVRADRELPVVWAVAKGSLRNKAILVPAALAISAWASWAVLPLLMIGGVYLCYEGFEKLAHKLLHRRANGDRHDAVPSDLASAETARIKGAVRTDFVLSAEIIVIALGSVAGSPFSVRAAVLVGIALLMTVGVYGLVAGIVKLDDAGLHLSRRRGRSAAAKIQRRIGVSILRAAPFLMKGLGIAGTAAMFLVGGGILVHGIPALHAWGEGASLATSLLLDAVVGVVAGALVLAVARGAQRALSGARRPR